MNRFKKKVVLHVIDDKKFVPYCEETFDLKDIYNHYTTSANFKDEVLKEEVDFIVIHYLDFQKASVLNNVQTKANVIWFFWGRDAFILGKFHTKFLQSKTKKLYLKLAFERGFLHGVKSVLKLLLPELSDVFSHNKEIIKAFKKIDLIVPVMPKDFFLLKQNYNIEARMFHFNYVNPSLNGFNKSTVIKGNNILLGNSASYSNNHIEMIDMLSKQKLGDRKVIIPLSYGEKQYASHIENYANRALKNGTMCLRKFMPLSDYMELIETCSIVIMNHDRQQAVGNIIPMLALGAHVYLSEKSSLYDFLKEKGFHISKIDSKKNLRELNESEILVNKKLTFDYFGRERQQKKLSELLEKFIETNDY